MASGWAHFRKVWLKPEVYPLIGAMGAALGVMTVSLLNKARSPNVAWNKGKRGSGTLFDDVDEVVPLWNSSKANSTSIFSADSQIRDSKKRGEADLGTFVVKAGGEEEEEQEQEQEEQEEMGDEQQQQQQAAQQGEEAPLAEVREHAEAAVAQELSEVGAAAQPVADVVDESADAINAAVDAALEAAEPVTEHVAEAVAPAQVDSEEVPTQVRDDHDQTRNAAQH